MTDIDAIRKTKRYDMSPQVNEYDNHEMSEAEHGEYAPATALDSALSAYDAKCEELRRLWLMPGMRALKQAEAERDAAVRDAQRLDWVERFMHRAGWDNEGERQVIRAEDGAEFTGDSFREAIDAALAPPTEQTTEQTKVENNGV